MSALTGELGTGQGDTGTGTGTGQTTAGGTPPASWRDSLPDALKVHEALKGFEKVEQLAQRYVDVHDKVPQVPASPDKYALEGIKASDAVLKSYREMAHKAGMTEAQAKAGFEYWAGLATSQRQAAQQAAEAAAKTASAEAETKLKADWAANYDANMAKAKETLKRFGGDEFVQFLDTSGLGNNPTMAKFLLEVRKVMSEDVFVPNSGNQPKTGPKDQVGDRMLDFPSMKK
jgi:hypothetical protein